MSAHYYEARRTNDGSIIGVVYHREHTRKQLSVGGSFSLRIAEVIDYESTPMNGINETVREIAAIDAAKLWCQDNSIQAERGVPLSEQNEKGEG